MDRVKKQVQVDEEPRKEDIESVEKWAAGLLMIQHGYSSRHAGRDVRMAQTLIAISTKNHHALAVSKCQIAQGYSDSSTFEATLYLSKIFENNGDKNRALQELSRIRPYIQSSQFREKYQTRWQEELDRFWRLCNDTDSPREALTACKELSDQSTLDPAEYIEKGLEWMNKTRHLRDAFGVILSMRETDGRSLLTAALQSTASSDNASFHQHLYMAFIKDPKMLLKGYMNAILESTETSIAFI